jgi:5-methylcytosine-specific restriction protein A
LDHPADLTVGALVESLARLRSYRSPTGRLALYQPLTLVWAVGLARDGLTRMTQWGETRKSLDGFLERHGEHPRSHYPLTAFYHAGLRDLDGPEPVPPAHGMCRSALVRRRPYRPAYNLVRYSGEARVAVVKAMWANTLRMWAGTRSWRMWGWRATRSQMIKHQRAV